MSTEVLVGIDLGTTYSAIARIGPDGKPEIICNAEGGRITPSVVQIRADGSTLVGAPAKAEAVLEKENTAQFFKRDIGANVTYDFHGRPFTPVDLSVEVLKKLKSDAEQALGTSLRRAVITVPAYFQDQARIATRTAGERAGFEVLQIVNEPTAAAIAYGLHHSGREEVVLVYDLGGGTFDVTLVRVHAAGIEVIGTDGNHTLGGKDWDDRLVQFAAGEFRSRRGQDPLDEPYTFQELLVRAEEAKKSLSERTRAVIPVNCGGAMERIEVTRQQLEALTADLMTQTEILVTNLLSATGFTIAQVDGVLLVGGATRMPMCREFLQRLTGKPPRTSLNPDESVAIGAAIQAAICAGLERPTGAAPLLGRKLQVSDVMSHSMGMIAVSPDGTRYINSTLIPRNRPIPCKEVRPYRVQTRPGDGNSTAVFVTQGEGEDPSNASFVGKYEISKISHADKGSGVLEICYAYDRSGVVTVTATEQTTGRELPIRKEALPADMSWVYGSPRDKKVLGHKTVYLAVDLSGSMSGAPLANAKQALRVFIDKSDLAHTSVGLLSFASRVRLDTSTTQDAARLHRVIRDWDITSDLGICSTSHPFDELLAELKDVKGRRLAVVLTDGIWSCQAEAEQCARACHQAEIEIIAIGFGSADEDFLRRLATSPEGALYTDQGGLGSAFGQIAQVLVESDEGLFSSGLLLRRRQ
jgi:molecular chaperone DnaK